VVVGSDPAGRILAVLGQQPDRIFTPAEVADILEVPHGQDRANLRLLLSRMARDGRAARAGYGRYRAVR
jgi:predicted transcriptional regulator of viral defense system